MMDLAPTAQRKCGKSRKAVDVNPQTIGYLERGDYKPSLELGLKIAAVFNVPIEVLFSFTPFPSVADALKKVGDAI
jgi:putative transcriptional regulator